MFRPIRLLGMGVVAALALGGPAAGCFGSGSPAASSDGGTLDVTQTSIGLASPQSESFGTVAVGQQSAAITVTVSNAGSVATGTVLATLMGGDAGDFGIDADGCADKSLPPSGSCTVQVHFKPSKSGPEATSLAVSASPGGLTTTSFSGTGGGASTLSFSPTTQSLGTVAVGATSAPATFTLTNGGTGASGNVTVALTGTDGVDFALASDTCTGKSLAASATCTVGVSLAPKTLGSKAASLTATGASTPGTATASLAGTATDAATFSVTPSPFDFGPVSQGTTPPPEQTFTVKNTGGADSSVPTVTAGSAKDFAIADNACTAAVPAGATCTFGVTFAPSATGPETTTVTVGGTSITPVAVTVTGTGLAPATISIDPTTQPLGSVAQGASGSDSPFVVTNGGGVTTGSLSVQLGGANGDQFALGTDGCTGQTLAPGGTCTVDAHAAPKVGGPVGALQASLTVSGTPGGATSATLTATAMGPANLTVSPTSQPMGTVAQNASSGDLPFVVTNSGGQTSGTLTATLGGTGSAAFGLGTDGCTGQTLAAGTSCTVNVHFTPSTVTPLGSTVATLSVAATPGGTATANLTGTTAAPASLLVAPVNEPYPNTPQGTVSPDVTFTVYNKGGVATGALKAVLGGANVGQFAIGTDGCTGQLLAPQTGTCTITAHFAPTVGTLGVQQQTLSVSGTPGGTGTANLTGTATTPLTITPPGPTLASGAYESPGATTTLTVTSVSLAPVGPLAIAVPAQFALDATKTTCSGAKLTAAAPTCTVGVYLSPTAAAALGAISGTLTVSASATTSATDTLSSTVLAPATLAITSATGGVSPFVFPTQRQSTSSAPMAFTLTNNGGVPSGTVAVAVGGTAPGVNDFVISNNGCAAALAPTKSCTFDVTFTPSTSTTETATLGATTTAGLPATGTLQGAGAQPVLQWENGNDQAISTWAYGGVPVSGGTATPVQATFVLYNAGTVSTNKLSVSGTLAAGYAVLTGTGTTCLGQPLAAGGRCNITVTFQNATPCAAVSTSLVVTDAITTSPGLALSATGISSAVDYVLTITPAPLHLAVNAPGALTLTLQNCGITPVATAGDNVAEILKDADQEFTALTNTANCVGLTLNELQSCTFGLSAVGGPQDGTYGGEIIVVLGNQQTVDADPEVITP
ncbi:MAG TPA: choice-of-anchor D domain-containing protein [Polyangiaceae bacterium]|jgi:hypothetical protein